jgi:site-specific recombinase XerD
VAEVQLATGRRLFYDDSAAAAGPPLLLLMGGGESGRMWARQTPALALAFRVLAPDHRDSGESPPEPAGAAYTAADLAGDAVALLDALDVPRAHVAGTSMGGMVALRLALDHPARVERLVLLSTPVGGVPLPVPPRETWSDDHADWIRGLFPQLAAPGYFEVRPGALEELAALGRANGLTYAGLVRHLAVIAGFDARGRLGDVQAFATALAAEAAALTPASQARALAAVKSLLAFGHRLGYLPFDVGGAVRLPRLRSALAERILSEADVHRLLALEPDARNRALLRLLYAGGLRVSELVALRWRDLQARDAGEGQVTVYGKGGKTRAVLLPATVWGDLQALREGAAAEEAPVFRSRKGGPLTARQAQRLVDAAAKRAGLRASVSPHWLRHAHATHALERGAPIHIVQATLGHASVATTGRYLHARPTDSSARYLAV